jgi:ABC-2 type transport system ATP-binding protein
MREIRLLLRRLAHGGTTVFVSSHLLWEVEEMCDLVGVLARGRLVAEGPPSNLRPSGNRIRLRVDDAAAASRVIAALDGVEADAGSPEDGVVVVRLQGPATAGRLNAELVRAGVEVSELTPEHERLEDVFLDLVGDAEPDGGGG